MEKIRYTIFQKQEKSGRNGFPAVASHTAIPRNKPAV